MNWKEARDFLIARAAERSTQVAAIALVSTFGGIAIKPEYAEQIALAGSAFWSVVQILLKEKGSEK